jgi:hypothetical protein
MTNPTVMTPDPAIPCDPPDEVFKSSPPDTLRSLSEILGGMDTYLV